MRCAGKFNVKSLRLASECVCVFVGVCVGVSVYVSMYVGDSDAQLASSWLQVFGQNEVRLHTSILSCICIHRQRQVLDTCFHKGLPIAGVVQGEG